MNKAELVEKVASQIGMTKAAVTRTIDALIETITTTLKRSENVALIGFGAFGVRKRLARTGRNPKTNQPVAIKAAKVPIFRAGKRLKSAIN